MSGLRLPDYGPIRALLARTRGRALAVSLGTAAAATAAGALALGLLGSLVLGTLSPDHASAWRWLGALVWTLAVLGALVAAWRWVWRPLRELGAEARVALRLERSVPALAGLASAVELERESEASAEVPWSRELAEAHVSRLARAAGEADPRAAVSTVGLSRAALVLGLAASVHLAALFFVGDTLARGYGRLLGLETPIADLLSESAGGVAPLITGDVELTYHYPGYTRLPPKTVTGTGGDVSALKGTEVEIRTTADRDVARASLVVGETALPMTVSGKRTLAGRLVVDAPGTYRFRFEDDAGQTVAEGAPRRIAVEADARPEVEAGIDGKDGDDEIEVREQDRMLLRWRASDDFGLTEVALVWRIGGGQPERLVLDHPEEQTRTDGHHLWDLTTLHLAPGDRVAFYVEAVDDDAVSGPKKGTSATHYLKVFSAAEHHRELMARVEAQWEAMVLSLADHLEKPFDVREGATRDEATPKVAVAEGLVKGLDDLVEGLNDVVDQLGADPLAPPVLVDALANVRAGIVRRKGTARNALRAFGLRLAQKESASATLLVRRAQGDVVDELEKDVLYLEDLLDKQKVQDLIAMAEEIKTHRRRLAELIDQLRKNPDEETRAAIGREIARIKERVHELMRKMSELAKSINDEHLNADAMRQLSENQDLLGNLDDVQKLLNEGKLDEALARLSDMAEGLDKMLEDWRQQDQKFGGEEYREVAQKMMQLMDDLQRVERDQKHLLEKTSKLKDAYQKELEKRMKGRLDELVERLKKQAEQARGTLEAVPEAAFESGFARFDAETHQGALASLENLGMLLEARDFSEAHDVAQQALRQASNLAVSMHEQAVEARRLESLLGDRVEVLDQAADHAAEGRDISQDIVNELDRLFPDPRDVFGREDQKKMAKMGEQQEALRRRTASLQQKMDEISKKAPVFSPGMEGELRQAGRHMGEAGWRLGQSDARSASGQQKAALDRLGRLEEQMQQMAQNQGGSGMPMPMSSGGRGSGAYGMSQEKVEIPDADQYKAPDAFRKELLDAMKEGTPERYQQQVKRYYEELVK